MKKGMVCAPQPEAAEAGALVLKSGGNAIDAAIATALTQTAVDPFMCGIAGFGSMHVYLPGSGTHQCLDFHARAPRSVKPDMWEDKLVQECEDGFGFILEGRVNEVGGGARENIEKSYRDGMEVEGGLQITKVLLGQGNAQN